MPTLLFSLLLAQEPRPELRLPPLYRTVCGFGLSQVGPQSDASLPGGNVIIGQVQDRGDDGWLVASLGEESGAMVLRAAIRDAHMEAVLDLDLSPGSSSPFELTRDVQLGPLTMLEDAYLQVLGFDGRQVRISPVYWTDPSPVEPKARLEPLVPCEALRLVQHRDPDYQARIARAAGVEGAEERALLGRVRVYDDAGKVVLILAEDYSPHVVAVTGRHGGWADVVLTDWTGLIWRGQVEEGRLVAVPDGAMGGILGGLGQDAGGEKPVYRACTQDTPLMVVVAGAPPQSLGTLFAGAPFVVSGEGSADTVNVQLPRAFFDPAEGVKLALPAAARDCPVAP